MRTADTEVGPPRFRSRPYDALPAFSAADPARIGALMSGIDLGAIAALLR